MVLTGDTNNPIISGKNTIVMRTPSAITYKINGIVFQVILLDELLGSPNEIINQFDFTVTQGAYDCSCDNFTFGKDFLKHIAQRRLVFNLKANYPIASLFRVNKYLKKG